MIMDPNAQVQVATMGTKLEYGITDDTTQAVTWTRVYGLASTPDFGGEPNKIDTTTLDNTVAETQTLGLMPAVEVSYEFNVMALSNANANIRLIKTLADAKSKVKWRLTKASGITFEYEAKSVDGKRTWLRRNIAMIQTQSDDIIAFTSVKDISAQIDQSKREEAYIRALATEYESITVVSITDEDTNKDKVINHNRLSENLSELIDEETANEVYYSKKLQLMANRFVYPDDREKFIENTIDKTQRLKELIQKRNSKALIEIDGGVNYETGKRLLNAGADVLVAGSFVFGAENPLETIANLKAL